MVQANCCIGFCLRKFRLGFFHTEHKQMWSLELRRTVSEEFNTLPTIQIFNLLFGKTVLYVTFVDTKGVDDKYGHGMCSVVCNEF